MRPSGVAIRPNVVVVVMESMGAEFLNECREDGADVTPCLSRLGKEGIFFPNTYATGCVDNLLNGFPCMVVVFGCVVCLLMIVLPKSLSVVLTMVYVAFILYETLMFRESGDARTNFVLFSYAGKFLKEQSVRVGDRKSTRLNSSHSAKSRMPSSA